jgi:hypothetical protein
MANILIQDGAAIPSYYKATGAGGAADLAALTVAGRELRALVAGAGT